jgi:hypothetical protein
MYRSSRERGNVAALWNGNQDGILSARADVVHRKRLPQPSRLASHDTIDPGVKIGPTVKDVHRNRWPLETLSSTFQGLDHEMAEELRHTGTHAKL